MKIKKILYIFLILIVIISFTNYIYADESITNTANDFIKVGTDKNSKLLQKIHGTIFKTNVDSMGFTEIAGLLQGIGIFIAIGVGIVLGMKFMLSSAEGKAEVSKILAPYLIGVALVVGALTIWKVFIEILDI